MSITSPTAARTHVYTLLSPLAVAGQVTVQPAAVLPMPKPVTIACSPAGQNATEFLVRVTVNADAAVDMPTAIGNVESTTVAAETALVGLPRTDWTTGYNVEYQTWTAQTVVAVGREDF